MNAQSSDASPNTSPDVAANGHDLQQMAQEIERLRGKLRFAEHFIDAIFEQAPYPIVVFDVQNNEAHNVIRANRAGRALVGDIGDMDAVQFQEGQGLSPETMAEVHARLAETVAAGTTQRYHEELELHNRTVWTQALFTPVPGLTPGSNWVSIVTIDVTEQKLRELETVALREQIIQQQAIVLNELSTPLLSISDDVVVLPLVGTIDSHRAQQIIEALLNGIASLHAHTAIIDITGVSIVDTQVANAIIRAAYAARLLGANVVLTGIRPEIAQVMIGLGIDLGTIVTHSSLQAGITYSLKR